MQDKGLIETDGSNIHDKRTAVKEHDILLFFAKTVKEFWVLITLLTASWNPPTAAILSCVVVSRRTFNSPAYWKPVKAEEQ